VPGVGFDETRDDTYHLLPILAFWCGFLHVLEYEKSSDGEAANAKVMDTAPANKMVNNPSKKRVQT
jgi:hypothetical protein